MIAILCASEKSNYFKLSDKYELDIYTEKRNCREFKFNCPVITHAPCQQWSRLHKFAKVDPGQKALAWFCYEAVKRCSGIFEHPAGSHFFKSANIKRSEIYSVNLSWFGYKSIKRTYLYYNSVSFASHPLNFNAIEKTIEYHTSKLQRYTTPIAFNEWLIQSVLNSQPR